MALHVVERPDAEALIRKDLLPEIIQGTVKNSIALSNFRKLRPMPTKETSMPVLNELPTAYWVKGDTGMKKTAHISWRDKTIIAEEIAVILVFPDAVYDDVKNSGYDLIGESIPWVNAAFGKKIDEAIIFGVDKPASWRKSIVDTAIDAGAVITPTGDLFQDVNSGISRVERSGFRPNGILSGVETLGELRGMVDGNNRPLFLSNVNNGANEPYRILGLPVEPVLNDSWNETLAKMLIGDMSQAVYSIRQDLTYKIVTTGSVPDPEDPSKEINLLVQDSFAVRFVMRLGWELPNPISQIAQTEETRSPFSVILPEGTGGGAGAPTTPQSAAAKSSKEKSA